MVVSAIRPVDRAQQIGIAAVDRVTVPVQAILDSNPVEQMLDRIVAIV